MGLCERERERERERKRVKWNKEALVLRLRKENCAFIQPESYDCHRRRRHMTMTMLLLLPKSNYYVEIRFWLNRIVGRQEINQKSIKSLTLKN